MDLIQYHTVLSFDDPQENKPIAIENKSFPYNQISDDRRYEELVYSLYDILIKENKFESFEGISLMSGVHDKGRDCALFNNGKSTGIIQCKRYTKNLSKQQFGEEITKFVLYSLLDSRLIPDKKKFTYYIAVSTGFVMECSDFIDDFNANIVNENDLQKWVSKNLKHPTIKPLELQPSTFDNVLTILAAIKVKKIYPQDLDALLVYPSCQHLQPLFFQVRTLVSDVPIKNLEKTLLEQLNNVLTEPRIKQELHKGSASLHIEKNHFDDISDSHILRKETEELFEWINAVHDLDELDRPLNVCLLAANAGMGKTVILKDLYDQLTHNNVPVLGLKADKLHSSNIQELQFKTGVKVPVLDLIEQCKEKYNKTVIIIDQIDALSQSMSSNRSYLDVFKLIIDQFTYDPNIRLIVSVRIFDLHYDPSLKVYKNLKTVKVGLLSESEVFEIVKKKGINENDISKKLLYLLRTPSHLNIYTRVSSSINSNSSIRSLHELYTELYKSKVRSISHQTPVDPSKIKKLLFKIANKMFTDQTITVNEFHFDNYLYELNYLESERLIKKDARQLQFFHQTFYDYIFAKRFVEKKSSIIEYIKQEHQSILIRSAIKMIINYLREYNPKIYFTQIKNIFKDDEIFFHIKHMCYCWILFQDSPFDQEIELLLDLACNNIEYRILYFDNAQDNAWFLSALKKDLLTKTCIENKNRKIKEDNQDFSEYQTNSTVSFLHRFISKNTEGAWDLLFKLNDTDVKQSLLFYLDNCPVDNYLKLFEQCPNLLDDAPHTYYVALYKISQTNPDFCFNLLEKKLLNNTLQETVRNTVYQENKLLNSLSAVIPWKLSKPLIKNLIEELESNDHNCLSFYDDHIYTRVNLNTKKPSDKDGFYYWLLANCLREMALLESPDFKQFLDNHLTSRYEAVLRLIIHAISGSLQYYSGYTYKLFLHFYDNKCFLTASDLGVEFRDLFQNSFTFFNLKQQKNIVELVLSLRIPTETVVRKYNEKSYLHLKWGFTQHILLRRFPENTFKENLELKKRRDELDRKFKNFKETYSSGNLLAGIVRKPLNNQAYNKMTATQWLSSFRIYDSERDAFAEDFLKGGLREHSWAFKDHARNYPKRSVEIIEQAIEDITINRNYALLGMLGLIEIKYDPEVIHKLFKKLKPSVNSIEHDDINFFVRIAGYIIESNIEDNEVLNYIIDSALDWSKAKKIDFLVNSETSEDDLVRAAIGTDYGISAKALLGITDKKYKAVTFDTIEKILKDGPAEAKAIVLNRFVYLNNLDREKSFEIFSNYLLQENNIYITVSALWSLQYMVNINFKKFIPVFTKMIESKNLGKDDSNALFLILYSSYLYEEDTAEKLLKDLILRNLHTRSWALHVIFKNYYHNEQSHLKGNTILDYLMDAENINPSKGLVFHYLNLDHIELIDIEKFLTLFISSSHFYLSGQLLTYLTQQCSKYVNISINIFNQAILHDNKGKNREPEFGRDQDTIKFIVGAFNALKSNDVQSVLHRKNLLKSFDSILKDYRYQRITEKILEELV
ncbi:AAA family ATPase [Flavobacterium hydatis]|uniref:ATP-binding protein n=1 Tax=Flavobacterium hydatis TaxID=991 RepID=A0A086AIK8_FLAHY|nr:ATP-binding protein [Flavobacterium hydatis]KFF16522.1 hypothetical protein IW20_10130 [Flavobacterium hydatis]OXA93919.1 ATP-binding protein [Flavobacterium hydatis]